ncbi:histone chaperone ASF1A [Paramuricea clavata]|uniref:Histone chaperone ASF1A n=1 Tax=Paramuricea clavata TaxID=317549 RepID=A0A7D9DBK3_PARCT|nr:histone chaperone ASF1A [Paramuricea clavata]
MAKVNICNVTVLDNPSPYFNPFQFEITFECLEDLSEDLEWKLIYVGSAESSDYDQVLDSVLVGPVPGGRHMFVFQADSPDPKRIPIQDAIGVTVLLLTCAYRGQEFARIGYYINNEYIDSELKENPPDKTDFQKLVKTKRVIFNGKQQKIFYGKHPPGCIPSDDILLQDMNSDESYYDPIIFERITGDLIMRHVQEDYESKWQHLTIRWQHLTILGPEFGYFPNASKTTMVVKEAFFEQAKDLFEETAGIKITTDGHKILGAACGKRSFVDEYIADKIDEWEEEIETLSKIAEMYPHAAYIAFTRAIVREMAISYAND